MLEGSIDINRLHFMAYIAASGVTHCNAINWVTCKLFYTD